MSSPSSPTTGNLRQSTTCQTSTPPDKTIDLPPSPPASAEKPATAVAAALALLRARRGGKEPATLWNRFRISPGDYIELKSQLRQDEGLCGYVEDKVRYDYDPETQELVIRMTTPTHDLFVAKVVKEIESQLEAITSGLNQSAADAARSVGWQGTSRILLTDDPTDDSKYPKRSPDAAFRHAAATYPGVVIEVSYSQKRKELEYLAESYIIGSRGSIRLVVGLDIEYRTTKKATVSVWRARIGTDIAGQFLEAERTVESEEFRRDDGSPVQKKVLALAIQDFAPPEVCPNAVDIDQPIELAYSKLAEFLTEAEDSHQLMEKRLGKMRTLPSGTRLKKRQRTPPEELTSADEACWQADEASVQARMESNDVDWRKGSRRRL